MSIIYSPKERTLEDIIIDLESGDPKKQIYALIDFIESSDDVDLMLTYFKEYVAHEDPDVSRAAIYRIDDLLRLYPDEMQPKLKELLGFLKLLQIDKKYLSFAFRETLYVIEELLLDEEPMQEEDDVFEIKVPDDDEQEEEDDDSPVVFFVVDLGRGRKAEIKLLIMVSGLLDNLRHEIISPQVSATALFSSFSLFLLENKNMKKEIMTIFEMGTELKELQNIDKELYFNKIEEMQVITRNLLKEYDFDLYNGQWLANFTRWG